MSANASIIAIVPFDPTIADLLDYEAECYEGTKQGSLVTTELFLIRTSSASRELADILGVKTNDFSTYHLTNNRAAEVVRDSNKMRELTELCETAGETKDATRFAKLTNHPGTQFHFRYSC